MEIIVESKGGRIESPRFKLDGEIGKNRFYRLTFSAKWFKPFGMEIWNIESWPLSFRLRAPVT